VTFVDTSGPASFPPCSPRKFDVIISGMTITADARRSQLLDALCRGDQRRAGARRRSTRSRPPRTWPASAWARSSAAAADQVAKQFRSDAQGKGKPGYTDYKLYDHYPEA